MSNIIENIFHLEKHEIDRYARQADRVISLEKEMHDLTDDELKAKTPYFRELLKKGKKIEDIKYEAFAVAREAARRTLCQFPFKVQIMGALVLNDGNVAEMKTGEGKTLTATMTVYLNALKGEGVHVVTVNEYLAARDADWMGQIYRFLGLTVGVNLASETNEEKKAAYLCDVTYTTNSELGFDYLRDNMTPSLSQRVLRGLKYSVVDEADSILIDEARTPLIISGGSRAAASQYQVADRFVKAMRKDKDFTVDIKTKTCSLSEDGNNRAEAMFGVRNLYDPENQDLVHRIHQALKANYVMGRDVEYLVDQDHQIQLIDQSTGRIMPGREYNDGLQQAIQAKEGVEIKQETVVLATITYQNFFRLYKKMSGMTGTAKTEEEEFEKIYNMKVLCIPTDKPVIRTDAPDLIFATHNAKLAGLVKDIKERHEKGQPILIGTVSVESNEEISKLLDAAGLPHEVLNAKNASREAEIIKRAGEKGAITLATNMAGRGTDIKLGEGVKDLGGLCVFGTERHEARRIDNQLRGRSGRQGDPGFSRFYVSFDDELMRRFAPEGLRKLFTDNLQNDSYSNKMLMNAVTGAQKQIEGKNFDVRKNLLDYDDVLAKQRQIIYDKRDNVMMASDISDLVKSFFIGAGNWLARKAVVPGHDEGLISGEQLKRLVEPRFMPEGSLPVSAYDEAPVDEAGDDLGEALYESYLKKRATWPKEDADKIERQVSLSVVDQNWKSHIDTMSHLREGISLRSYAQTNPLQDYVNEGYDLFKEMNDRISLDTAFNLINVRIVQRTPEEIAALQARQNQAAKSAHGEGQVVDAVSTPKDSSPNTDVPAAAVPPSTKSVGEAGQKSASNETTPTNGVRESDTEKAGK